MEKLNTASANVKIFFAPLHKLDQDIKATSSQMSTSVSLSSRRRRSQAQLSQRTKKKRWGVQLDKELELHSTVLDCEETTGQLQAKLANLKAKVCGREYLRERRDSFTFSIRAPSLGIGPLVESAHTYPTYPYLRPWTRLR